MKKLFTFFSILFCLHLSAQNVGIGLTNPQDRLHVLSPFTNVGGLRVDVTTGTALRVHPNAGTSIGTAQTPPPGGLTVDGVIRPLDSIKATQNAIHIVSTADSIVLLAGGSRIILGANGAVKILAGGTAGITIDGGNGPVNISGSNVSISADGNFSASAAGNATVTGASNATLSGAQTFVTGSGLAKMNAGVIQIGNSGLPAARAGDFVNAPGGVGTIVTGSMKVLIE